MESRRLSIPIYLNQRIVFDLLAIIEGGFSQFQTIKSSDRDEHSRKIDASADLGSKNVFAFLNLGLKAGLANQGVQATQREVAEEKVFTPASLFSRLRDHLLEKKLLLSLDDSFDSEKLKPGNFIEFSGVLSKNPMVGTMESLIQIMEVAMLFSESPKKKPKEDQDNLLQMKKFLSMLTQAGSLDLVAHLVTAPDIQAVIPVQMEYFSNESPADIIDGQFVVFGKVVRYLPESSSDSINLLRGTPLALLPQDNLQEMTQGFVEFGQSFGAGQAFVTQVSGPSVLVVPIAIYA